MTGYKHFILIALLASFTASCNVFEDIEENDSDSGVENPSSEDNDIESLRQDSETDSNNKKDGQKSTDANKPDSKDTEDSDSEDTGKPETTDSDTQTDTQENVTGCKEGELKCEEKCVPNDIRNCGKCDNDCAELPHTGDQVGCDQGVCTLTTASCDNGWADCNKKSEDGCETNITDASNCGECGNDCTKTDKNLCTPNDDGFECTSKCPSEAPTLCGDSCVDTANSALYCGKCDNQCPSITGGQPICTSGKCGFKCDSDYLECPDACFPIDDSKNCGKCGHDCAKLDHVVGQPDCTQGVCILTTASCDNGWADCNKEPADGCETNLTVAINCGECGNDCTKTNKKLCTAEGDGYQCTLDCPPEKPKICGDSCVNTDDHKFHCGKCGNECKTSFTGSSPVCADGECGFKCDVPTDLKCSDGCYPKDDDEHCDDCKRNCKTSNKKCDGNGKCVECMVHSDCNGSSTRKLCIQNECKECESGPCCGTDHLYFSNSRSCKTTTNYRCYGSGCGANVQEQVLTQYCSGDSPNCDGSEVGTWKNFDDCDMDQLCVDNGTTVSCRTCDYGCSEASGKCWSKCNPNDNPCCDGGTAIVCVCDKDSQLYWQDPKAPNFYTWQEAIDYCKKLTLGGHVDWRLPSREEIIEMLGDCDDDVKEEIIGGYCNSCAESKRCNELFGSDGDSYWSSSPIDDGDAWYVSFGNGRVGAYNGDIVSRVRCVRSGP